MRSRHALLMIALFTLVVALAAPLFGATGVPWDAFSGDPDAFGRWVLLHMRLPRVAAGLVAGAGLALGGAAFQALFRNPLADPFLLGVSSGAAAGAAAATFFGTFGGLLGFSLVSGGAFAGALAAIGVIYGLSRWKAGVSTGALLLAGVAVNYFFSSLVQLMQHLADQQHSALIFRVLQATIPSAGWSAVARALPFVLLGGWAVWRWRRELDLFAFGEELAWARGVDVPRLRRRLFAAVSLMTAGIVALCGPIAFVGLMAPHIVRRFTGPEHRYLLPGAALFGGAFVAAADAFARTARAPDEFPVGLVTALCGGPFFLALLWRHPAAADRPAA